MRRRPIMLPPVCHPTQQHVQEKCCEYIVPEIHPSHTTHVNKHLYKHLHSYPHTQSTVDQVYHQHFQCGPGPNNMQGQMGAPDAMGPQANGHMGPQGHGPMGQHMPPRPRPRPW
ncbi:spore coat protein [Salsuginibacillus kocurii]|uniref:spore coat protein n=1 Tax=Salsuginibacillus kocurii TaxID=427078 RepID=UPI0003636018|nr:spore coat protein [Salsuginibacillus kocurii]